MATSSEANTEIGDLLSQFKCLGTTDRDILIKELHSLLNNQISKEQCAFVLEMANWNLQDAVGAFFDYLGAVPSSRFTFEGISMKLEGRVTEPHGSIMTGSRFSCTWVVVNTGSKNWPEDARLVYYCGYYFNGILEGPIGLVKAGERKMITVSIFCPPVPGHYHTEMRLRSEQGFFGDKLLIEIDAVESQGVDGLTQQLSAMTTTGEGGGVNGEVHPIVHPSTEPYCGLEEQGTGDIVRTLNQPAMFYNSNNSTTSNGDMSSAILMSDNQQVSCSTEEPMPLT